MDANERGDCSMTYALVVDVLHEREVLSQRLASGKEQMSFCHLRKRRRPNIGESECLFVSTLCLQSVVDWVSHEAFSSTQSINYNQSSIKILSTENRTTMTGESVSLVIPALTSLGY
jgi:hypothetical protein